MPTNRNLASSLTHRPRPDTMQAYDALPPDLRQWLAHAILPWRAASVRRAWLRALKAAGGDRQAAQAALTEHERRRLQGDVARIWGNTHPFLAERAAPRDPS
jgi:Family of unknown function (DUF6525)